MKSIIRLITFQALWFANVYLGKTPFLYFAVPLSLFFLILDKQIFYKKIPTKGFILFSLFIVSSGVLIDSILLNLGFISFKYWNSKISSPFMWAMWIIFIPYYQIGFNRFKEKYFLTFFLAFIFAPISYYSGSTIGSMTLNGDYTLLMIGVMWGGFFPYSISVFDKLIGCKNDI